ncbi:hypothetical protein ACIRD2_07145 [Streptomyces sp. NPDC093595]|uniref:hypothetical protein n=1 Tax=Streptomyces sp. NPDC093595 TaxID=3366045 RepID=UPI0038193487
MTTDQPTTPPSPPPPEAGEEQVRQPVEGTDEPIRTLLWTAATYRPLEEVAALVSLLKRTKEVSSPGDEALRAAAVARPLEEVRQLVAMLGEPPHHLDEADTTLRAAAVGRPIEEVAQLVDILCTEDGGGWPRSAGTSEDTARDAAPAPAGDSPADTGKAADNKPTTIRRTGDKRVFLRKPGDRKADGRKAEDGEAAGRKGDGSRDGERKRPAVATARIRSAAPGDGDAVTPGLRSALRWPAAFVLLVCGLVHLPSDLPGLRAGDSTGLLAVGVTALCLGVGAWLTLRDTVRMWAAAAATGVGIVALHATAGVGDTDLLASSLGGPYAWASAAAVVCAALAAGLAASALLRWLRAVDPTAHSG